MSDLRPAHRSISEIIKAAGGPARIAEASAGDIGVDAVYKWPKIGVPDRHWPILMNLASANEAELFAANVAARSAAQERAAS